MWFLVILAIVWVLVTEHIVVFWLVFVPLAIFFVVSMFKFLSTRSAECITDFIAGIVALIIMGVVFWILCIP